VILTMPPRGSLKEAKEFAQKHGGWIAARLHRLPEAKPFKRRRRRAAARARSSCLHRPGTRGTVWTEIGSGGEALICVAGDAPHVDRRVGDFLRREALRDLESRERSRGGGAWRQPSSAVSVRDQSSRWGSCSTTGVDSPSTKAGARIQRRRIGQHAGGRARAPATRLIAHRDALDGDAKRRRRANARGFEIAQRLTAEKIADAAVDMRGVARDADQRLAAAADFRPHRSARAGAMDDTMIEPAQRHDGAVVERLGLGQAVAIARDPAAVLLCELLRLLEAAARRMVRITSRVPAWMRSV